MERSAVLFVFALILCTNMVSAIEITLNERGTVRPNTPDVRINTLRYEPYPVEPGETFDLWIKIQNLGGDIANDATCKLELDYPFTLYQGQLEQSYGKLDSMDTAVFEYKLKVDEDAVDGENEIIAKCSNNPVLGLWTLENFTIKVQTRYPTLNVVGVRTIPKFIEPGQNAKLSLTLENFADSSMKDIDIKLDFSSVPLAPFQEIGEKKLRRVNAGETENLSFNIIALSNAEGGIYKVPVLITYTDELGTAHSINDTIAVEINSNPDLYVAVDSTAINKNTKTGEIILKIINKGLTNIKYMNVKLLENEKQMKIISSDTVYIGDVDSDDSETAEFRITAKKSEITLPLQLDYKDVNNNPYSEQINVTLNLMSASELGQKGGPSWIVIVIILVLLFVIYKKRKLLLEKLGVKK